MVYLREILSDGYQSLKKKYSYEKDGSVVTTWDREPTLRPSSSLDYRECFQCKKPIYDDMNYTWALDRTWHDECFRCSRCTRQLTPTTVVRHEGKIYCDQDYKELFLPKCFSCTRTITEKPVKILQRNYHPLCFTCRKCSDTLCPYTYNFKEKNGSFYCLLDYHDLFSPKCHQCLMPVKDPKDMTRALGTTWHMSCFTCDECKLPLPGNNIWKKFGNYYCEDDYHKLYSIKCDSCKEPIRHNGIGALGKHFHADCCLRCAHCKKILKEDAYIQVEDKAYCKTDWVKFFAPKCGRCKSPVAEVLKGEAVLALGQEFHPTCFICTDCGWKLDENTYYELKNKVYCQEHYHAKTCLDCIKKAKADENQRSMNRIFGYDVLFLDKANKREPSPSAKSVVSHSRRSVSPLYSYRHYTSLRPKSSMF